MKMLMMVVTSRVTITKVMLCALLCALLLMTPTLAQSPVPPHLQCASNFDCSLNGICQPNSVCLCDKPWSGDRCGILTYKKNQPLSSANLYPLNASDAPKSGPCVTSQGACNALNTWNGPIVQVSETEYHMFVRKFIYHPRHAAWRCRRDRRTLCVAFARTRRYGKQPSHRPISRSRE